MKNRDKKVTSMITDNNLPVSFVKDIGQPDTKFVINSVAVCGRTDESCTVQINNIT